MLIVASTHNFLGDLHLLANAGYFIDLFIIIILLSILLISLILAFYRITKALTTGSNKQTIIKNLKGETPFISIHIPVCNEPPEMVINTINSCLNLQYSDFEIIVLCNNTIDKKLWKPIARFCQSYPEQIIFKHYERLSGYKAGALDVCRKLTHSQASHILTVDADYRLDRDALQKAVNVINDSGVQLLQFPQSYEQDIQLKNSALQDELYSYFKIFSNIGNRHKAALPTGTLSFLEIKALDAVGGWQAQSITEDAELGLKFIHKGYKTFFAPQVIGKGQLPLTIPDLFKQRSRWVFGNIQTLLVGIQSGFLNKKTALGSLLQLTAWLNLLAFPAIILALKALFLSATLNAPGMIVYLSLACIFIYLIEQCILLGIATDFKKSRWSGAFFIRIALTSVGAFSWLSALAASKKPFVCTNKFRKQTKLRDVPCFLPLLFLVAGVAFLMQGFMVAYIFLALHVLFLTASLVLYKQFRYAPKPSRAQLQNI